MKYFFLTAMLFFTGLALMAQYNKGVIAEPILKTDTSAIGQKIIYPNFPDAEVTMLKVTILPGQSTGWHKHKFPVFAYILKGSLTVKLKNNKIMEYKENSCFAEVFDTFHNGINKGKKNVVLLAFYMGEKGKPLSVRE